MSIQDFILVHGGDILMWVLAALAALASKWVAGASKNQSVNALLSRTVTEIGDAVMAVGKTYVEAIKAAADDGTLTDAEKAEAKAKAIATAKSNIGSAGLARLARVLGKDVDLDKWIGTKVESAVATLGASAPSTATVKVGAVTATATGASAPSPQ